MLTKNYAHKIRWIVLCLLLLLAMPATSYAQQVEDPEKPAEEKSAEAPATIKPLSNLTCDTVYVNSNNTLHTVDTSSAAATALGTFGASNVYDIAFSGNTLYGIRSSQLFEIDPLTGAGGSLIGPVGGSVNALAGAPDGTLYAAGGQNLYKVDPNTGAGALVGTFGIGSSSGDLAFADDGTLYAALTTGLAKVDLATGNATLIGGSGFSGIWGLAFQTGQLYGFTSAGNVLAIDTATGATTLIGNMSASGYGAATYRCFDSTPPSEPCIAPPHGMVAWYPFDEAAGTVADDLIGFNNGSHMGGPTVINEYVANSLNFDGKDDYVLVKDAPELNLGRGDITIDAWVRTDYDGTYNIIVDKRNTTPIGYSVLLYRGRLMFQMADPINGWVNYHNASSEKLNDGEWHLVAVTVDRDNTEGGQLYVDGELIHTFNPTSRAGSLDNNADLFIGRHHANSKFNVDMYYTGDIDEVELFKRALSPDEIMGLYKAGSGGKCKQVDNGCVQPPADMVAWYALDEASGAIAYDLIGSNDGGHINNPLPVSGMVANALEFNGKDAYVLVKDNPTLDMGEGDITIDAWVRTSYDGTYNIIVDKRDNTPIGYSMLLYKGHLMFQLADPINGWVNYYNASSDKLNDGEWHLVAVTIDRDDAEGGRLYVDGSLVHTFNPTSRSGSLDNDGDLFIGRHHANSTFNLEMYYDGNIDEVELFKRALSADEIAGLYKAGRHGKCKKRTPAVALEGEGLIEAEAESHGGLSVDYGKVRFPIRAVGQDVIVQANGTTWAANDLTQLQAGWNVTMIALDHLRGARDAENHVLKIGEAEEFKVRGCRNSELTSNDARVAAPMCQENLRAVPIVGESPLLLISAEPRTGMGTWLFSPQFQLLFSSLDVVDNYYAPFHLTIATGP